MKNAKKAILSLVAVLTLGVTLWVSHKVSAEDAQHGPVIVAGKAPDAALAPVREQKSTRENCYMIVQPEAVIGVDGNVTYEGETQYLTKAQADIIINADLQSAADAQGVDVSVIRDRQENPN